MLRATRRSLSLLYEQTTYQRVSTFRFVLHFESAVTPSA